MLSESILKVLNNVLKNDSDDITSIASVVDNSNIEDIVRHLDNENEEMVKNAIINICCLLLKPNYLFFKKRLNNIPADFDSWLRDNFTFLLKTSKSIDTDWYNRGKKIADLIQKNFNEGKVGYELIQEISDWVVRAKFVLEISKYNIKIQINEIYKIIKFLSEYDSNTSRTEKDYMMYELMNKASVISYSTEEDLRYHTKRIEKIKQLPEYITVYKDIFNSVLNSSKFEWTISYDKINYHKHATNLIVARIRKDLIFDLFNNDYKDFIIIKSDNLLAIDLTHLKSLINKSNKFILSNDLKLYLREYSIKSTAEDKKNTVEKYYYINKTNNKKDSKEDWLKYGTFEECKIYLDDYNSKLEKKAA